MKMSSEQKLIYNITNKLTEKSLHLNMNEYDNINWKHLVEVSNEQMIFPLIYEYVKEHIPINHRLRYKIHYKKHRMNIEAALQHAFDVQELLLSAKCRFVVVKGFILSKILYGNAYMRQIGDIDILVHEGDIIKTCHLLESKGYNDQLLTHIHNSGINVPHSEKEAYYYSSLEKKYKMENFTLVEIKKDRIHYNAIEVMTAVEKKIMLNINGKKFCSLSISDMFIFISEKVFYSISSIFGICNAFTIRTIVDYYIFIINHANLFTDEYIAWIDNTGHINHVALAINVLRSYFQERALLKIPKVLLDLVANPNLDQDHLYDWQSTFIERLFNKQKRESELQWMHQQNNFKNAKMILSENLEDYEGSSSNGMVSVVHPAVNIKLINSLLTSPILFGAGHDKSRITLFLKIPQDYPDVVLNFLLFIPQAKKGTETAHQILCQFVGKQVQSVSTKMQDVQITNRIKEGVNIVSLSVPRHTEIKLALHNESKYFCYIKFEFLNMPSCGSMGGIWTGISISEDS